MRDLLSYDDRHLMLLIKGGSEPAFKALFDRYKERFYSAALTITRSEEQAEEAVQEVFIKVWLRRDTLDTIEKPETYLFTMVYHQVYSQFKKIAAHAKMVAGLADNDEAVIDNATQEFLNARENRQLLDRAVQSLPKQQRLVYTLSKTEGLSREEVAKELGISPNTVKNHLAEAMRSLRNFLENEGALVLSILFWRHL